MWKDPIVEEIHAIRARIARECDYDLARIMNLLRKNEAGHSEGIVRRQGVARLTQHRRQSRTRKAQVST